LSTLKDLIKDDDKKIVEPFNLVGRRSQIFSKDEAAKILRENSYYFFVAAAILLGLSAFIRPTDICISRAYIIRFGVFYLVLGFCIRKLKSRIASLLALGSFGYVIFSRIIQNDIGGLSFIALIFLAASYRSVKASFFYHKT